MLEKALRVTGDPAAESAPVSSAEVAGAVLGMAANALCVAMETGLPVVQGDPIPDNYVAVFLECEAPRGRILLVSLLRFCAFLLSIVELPLSGGEGHCLGVGAHLKSLLASAHEYTVPVYHRRQD